MQTAVINSRGTRFAYIDSGAAPGDTYSTIVLIHGHGHTAETFARLLPYAGKRNLRVIALTRRGYQGSTPISNAEIEKSASADQEAHSEFLQQRGLEIAEFLAWVVTEKKIPGLSVDRKSGGLILAGWSLGNSFTMSFFAYLSTYPKSLVELLRPYIKTHIQYDCARILLGEKDPEEAYYPFGDPALTDEEKLAALARWLTTYFTHPYFSLQSCDSTKDERSAKKTLAQLQQKVPAPSTSTREPSSEKNGSKEYLATVDHSPTARADAFFRSDTDGDLALRRSSWFSSVSLDSGLLPDVNVIAMYGTATVWCCVLSLWAMQDDAQRWKEEGKSLRRIRVSTVEGANHFFHWDEPEAFLDVILRLIGTADEEIRRDHEQ